MARIYAVETDETIAMVKADSQAQALNHVIKSTYKVRIATAVDVVEYMQAGGTVEDVSVSPAPVLASPGVLPETGEVQPDPEDDIPY